MEIKSLAELKRELSLMHPAALAGICIQLARYKKENKELLGYLLFDSNYEPGYILKVKAEIDGLFTELNRNNLYFTKKGIRKILKVTNRYIKYSPHKKTEAELRLHYITRLKESGVRMIPGTALGNLFDGQVDKISKAIETLHEDLRRDYTEELKQVTMKEKTGKG